MGPKDVHSTVLSVEEEALAVAFRKHTLLPLDDCLYALQATIPQLTRSSLHRCLQRHGMSRLPDMAGDRPKKRFKTYPIGYFHIYIAEVRTEEGRLYLFVAVDRTSKFAHAELREKATRKIAAAFLQTLIEIVPYRVHTVLTDNGIQFTDLPRNRTGPDRAIQRSPVRPGLQRAWHRAPADQAEPPLDKRPGRENEPHSEESDSQKIPL